MSDEERAEPTACSFCGKLQGERVHLVTAHGRSICNYCVAFAYQIFAAEGQLPFEPEDPAAGDGLEDTVTRPKPPRADR